MVRQKNKRLKPTFWIEKERFDGKIVDCLTVILKTTGCYWAKKSGCLMCGYIAESYPSSYDELVEQFEFAVSNKNFQVLKIFTSGSFFDVREIPEKFRKYVYSKVNKMGVKKLIVESRPEFVTQKIINELSNLEFSMEVGIGLETTNDFVREHCINKGFTFKDFERAAKLLKENDVRVKAYLLLKPPFLSEKEAIEDAINSALKIKGLVDVVSLNPTNVQSNTYVEKLWKLRLYRPPWLWSVVEVLRQVSKKKIDIISDPVAAGKVRGPHNCGKCDKEIAKAIRDFSLYQDVELLDLDCNCKELWKRVVELENYSRTPLAE
ncbi:TIGR01210 family radical SAM protein [Archaeoglobales archaeon]|nr:MAG: TIGR01210 family radical SAM protein [Archaeoglobales archaeon]